MWDESKRNHLRKLVNAKGFGTRPLTDKERDLGFLGWHERGYLPHCDYPGLTQLITFRLADSMPASRRGEWEHLLTIKDTRDKRKRLEEYLDRGVGECALRDVQIAQVAEDSLLFFHEQRYDLLAWCIMPNHVHALVDVCQTPLWRIMRSWKRFIATFSNRPQTERRSPTRHPDTMARNAPARRAALQWQREYWDTFMRDEQQECKAIRYIENNPIKAGLCKMAENWPFSSARFRDQYRQLIVPAKKADK
jgi:REP-associated tyrosine transposase